MCFSTPQATQIWRQNLNPSQFAPKQLHRQTDEALMKYLDSEGRRLLTELIPGVLASVLASQWNWDRHPCAGEEPISRAIETIKGLQHLTGMRQN